MTREELKLIEQECTQIAESMAQLDIYSTLLVSNTIRVYKDIEKIAAALHRPVKIKCGEWQFWRTVTYKGIIFSQRGFYARWKGGAA